MEQEKYSQIFKAMGHPARLKMIEGLMKNECNVNKIVEVLNLPQSTISQHLGILKNAGIIQPRKSGVKTCYTVINEEVKKIIELIK